MRKCLLGYLPILRVQHSKGVERTGPNSLPSIAELYVFQMATQAGYGHTVIGIVLSKELPQDEKDEIVKSMGASVQPELKSDQSLDFMFLRRPVRDQVKALGTLIFRRP